MTTVFLMAGSIRRESLARRLAAACVPLLERAGAGVIQPSAELLASIPLYHGDEEAASGLPEAVRELQVQMARADAMLFACPEYNGSVTPLLKNTLDWCSRTDRAATGPTGLACFAGKAAGLVATSPGALGGLRAMVHVRDVLGYLGMLPIPQQLAVPKAHEAFAGDGTLADARRQSALAAVCDALVDAARRLRG
jgi:NAD(P)H-dependent FMN reductase